jgi:hypothetical protein
MQGILDAMCAARADGQRLEQSRSPRRDVCRAVICKPA